eukprot:gene14236-16798_t
MKPYTPEPTAEQLLVKKNQELEQTVADLTKKLQEVDVKETAMNKEAEIKLIENKELYQLSQLLKIHLDKSIQEVNDLKNERQHLVDRIETLEQRVKETNRGLNDSGVKCTHLENQLFDLSSRFKDLQKHYLALQDIEKRFIAEIEGSIQETKSIGNEMTYTREVLLRIDRLLGINSFDISPSHFTPPYRSAAGDYYQPNESLYSNLQLDRLVTACIKSTFCPSEASIVTECYQARDATPERCMIQELRLSNCFNRLVADPSSLSEATSVKLAYLNTTINKAQAE